MKIFSNFIEIFAKIMGKYRKFRTHAFVGGLGEAPEPSEIIKYLFKKSMETCKTLKIFMDF